MLVPFIFGKKAWGDNFTDRTADALRLTNNLRGGVSTIIISPRRWGKSSLVNKVMTDIAADSNYIVCQIDVFNCATEEQFYATLLNAVLRASATKLDEIVALVKSFLSSIGPKLTIGGDVQSEMSFGLDFKSNDYSVDEILDLPEKIAASRGKRFIISIDEFQSIEKFGETDKDVLSFQQKLRSHWQGHQNVSYCLFGSKRHMLLNIFNNYEMPFYKFGDVMMLEKIALDDWVPFIVERFSSTGKSISSTLARTIAERMECHPYYVQQYAQAVWFLTEQEANAEILDTALRQLIDRTSLFMSNIVDSLKVRQVSFLLAIARGEKNFSSAKTLSTYNLGSSANIKNLKKAVIDRDLVDEPSSGVLNIQDPLFRIWLLETF